MADNNFDSTFKMCIVMCIVLTGYSVQYNYFDALIFKKYIISYYLKFFFFLLFCKETFF